MPIDSDGPAAGSITSTISLKTLRRELRARRRGLSRQERRRHAAALTRLLGRDPRLLRARRIGAYWPADGELDPRPLMQLAHSRGALGFLPVLRPGRQRRLWFAPFPPVPRCGLTDWGFPSRGTAGSDSSSPGPWICSWSPWWDSTRTATASAWVAGSMTAPSLICPGAPVGGARACSGSRTNASASIVSIRAPGTSRWMGWRPSLG